MQGRSCDWVNSIGELVKLHSAAILSSPPRAGISSAQTIDGMQPHDHDASACELCRKHIACKLCRVHRVHIPPTRLLGKWAPTQHIDSNKVNAIILEANRTKSKEMMYAQQAACTPLLKHRSFEGTNQDCNNHISTATFKRHTILYAYTASSWHVAIQQRTPLS